MPKLIVKLTPLLLLARRGAVNPVSEVVLHVTLNRVPSAALGWIVMSLLVVTAVVLIVHVPVEAFVAQEKAPVGAAEQDTTEGFAAVPAAEQFVAVAIVAADRAPVRVRVLPMSAPTTEPNAGLPAALPCKTVVVVP